MIKTSKHQEFNIKNFKDFHLQDIPLVSYIIAFHPQLRRHLSAIPPKWHPRLESGLKLLAADPVTYSSRLHSPWENLYCYSSPPFRLIYRLFDREQTLAILSLSTHPA